MEVITNSSRQLSIAAAMGAILLSGQQTLIKDLAAIEAPGYSGQYGQGKTRQNKYSVVKAMKSPKLRGVSNTSHEKNWKPRYPNG